MKKLFAVVLTAAIITGCQSNAQKGEVFGSASDPAVQALNESAMRVARSSEQAALAQSVAGKASRVTEEYRIDLSKLPSELKEPLLLEGGFHGELEVFVRSLMDSVGWGAPVILGNRPTTPLMVAFTEQRRPPAYWLADAGYQAGEMADVVVNASLKQVVIRYKEAGGVR